MWPSRADLPSPANLYWRPRHGPQRAVVVLACAAALSSPAIPAGAQEASPKPMAVFEVGRLAGDWYQVAGTRSWSARRCLSDTRYSFRPKGAGMAAWRACTTALGIERRSGRAKGDGTGALRLRLVWPVFAPLPAAWSDFWILAAGSDDEWLLIGDRNRAGLAVLSRTVAIHESGLAQAIAAARAAGYPVETLLPVSHPAGATGLLAVR